MSAGLVTNQRVLWQVEAACAGVDCSPDVIEIAFFNDASTQLHLDYRRLQIFYDGKHLDWNDESRRNENAQTDVPRGEFMRITLSGADFAEVVHAKKVEFHFGLTGTSVFRVPAVRRVALQDLAKTMGLSV